MVLKFITPSVTQLIRPSLSGKSTIMFEILLNRDIAFDRKMGKIYYCFGVLSSSYERIKSVIGDDISFISGLPTEEQVTKWSSTSNSGPIILVLDDLMEEISRSTPCQNLVTRLTHHCQLSLFILSQNLFQKGGIYRCLSLNTHYFIFMKTRRDHAQLLYFGRQLFPFRPSLLYSAYIKATENVQYGYLHVVDLHPESKPTLSLTSNFLSAYPTVYLDKDQGDEIRHITL